MEISDDLKKQIFLSYSNSGLVLRPYSKKFNPDLQSPNDYTIRDFVTLNKDNSFGFYTYGNESILDVPLSDLSLMLKPITSIKPADMLDIKNICGTSFTCIADIIRALEDLHAIELAGFTWLKLIQYLKFKGYALSFMEYTVQDLVDAGVYILED